MKALKNFLLLGLMPIVALVALAGCEPDDPKVEKDSAINLKQTEVSVGLSGGTCFVEYEIVNPHDDASISVECEAEWISDFNTQSADVIRFSVAANESEQAREALVTVKYLYAEDATFLVKQGSKNEGTFAFENVDVTSDYFSITVDIVPSDKKTPYIIMSASPEYIEELGGTDEDIYADDYAYFEWVGSFYGMTAVEIMQERYKVGDAPSTTVNNATPGMSYVFYAYYVDYATGVRTSDITRFNVTAGHPQLSEVDFDMEVTVDGPAALTDAVPVGFDGDYYTDVISAAELADGEKAGYTKEEYIKLWWANIVVSLKADSSISEIIASNTCKGQNEDGTPRSQYNFELMQNTDYYFFAFALEENALCASTPKLHPFRTGAAEPSDNKLAITFNEITARKADVSITTTVAEDPYVTHIATADEWAKFGNNDAERMDNILSNVRLSYSYGNTDVTFTSLTPDTEYVVYAFGTRGGVATTGLVYESFTTKSGAAGNATISFADLGYYEVDDLEQYGLTFGESAKGKAILPIDVILTPEDHGDWAYAIWDWEGRNDEYNDENYIANLLWQIEEYGSSTTTQTYTILKWNNRYVRTAIVEDANGQYSELLKEDIYCEYDKVREPAEFVEWWDSWHGAGLQSKVYNSKPAAKKMEVDLSKNFSKSFSKLSEQTIEPAVKKVEVDEIVASR